MEESRKTNTEDIRKLRRLKKDRNENVSAQELGKMLPSFSLVVQSILLLHFSAFLLCLQVTNQGSYN